MEGTDWGALGSDWWLKTAREIGVSEKHAKFAAAKHRGSSNVQAAREAGFGSTPGSIKAEGHRLSRTNKINQLLALAAAEAGGGYDGTLSPTEARQILTSLARGSDPLVRIKAIESLGKIDKDEAAARAIVPVNAKQIEERLFELLPSLKKSLMEEILAEQGIIPASQEDTESVRDHNYP
jgi:hypothetical protein